MVGHFFLLMVRLGFCRRLEFRFGVGLGLRVEICFQGPLTKRMIASILKIRSK